MDIPGWRRKIDAFDRQLVELLNQRATAARAIGRLKRNSELPVYEPDREKTIFENVRGINAGPLSDKVLHEIFERIIDAMRNIQKEELAPAPNCAGVARFDPEVTSKS